jgi:uncharacterized Zn finger protein
MAEKLPELSEADIRARCDEKVYQRGLSYWRGGAVQHPRVSGTRLEARIQGTTSYRTWAEMRGKQLITGCSCPYDWGGDCKHIAALLLAWVHAPETFTRVEEVSKLLEKLSKEKLIALLLEVFDIYPDLPDMLGLDSDDSSWDATGAVQAALSLIEPLRTTWQVA